MVRANDAWKPQPKSPTRLPAKVGTERRICRADSQTPKRSTTVPRPSCRYDCVRVAVIAARLTATAVECSSSVNVNVMKPKIASRMPVTPRLLTVDPASSLNPLRT